MSLVAGSRAVIHSLTSDKSMNGMMCTLLEWLPEHGRWSVQPDHGVLVKRARERNLYPTPDAAPADTTVLPALSTFRLYVGTKRVLFSTLTTLQRKAATEHDTKTCRLRWIKEEQHPQAIKWGSFTPPKSSTGKATKSQYTDERQWEAQKHYYNGLACRLIRTTVCPTSGTRHMVDGKCTGIR